jgi:Recombination endonuclease VII
MDTFPYICIMKKRKCNKCGIEKELSSNNFCKDKYDKSGYTYQCKVCRAIKQKEWSLANLDKIKQINDKNKNKRKVFYSSPEGIESSRRAHLKRTYGLTLEEFNEKLKSQNNKCAICGNEETRDKHNVFAVDHCHKTGKIRDLLCWKCNSGLGLYNDNKQLLINAIKYLEKHESLTVSGLL